MRKNPNKKIFIPFEAFTPTIVYSNGAFYCPEGIARVIRSIIYVLLKNDYHVTLSCNQYDIDKL